MPFQLNSFFESTYFQYNQFTNQKFHRSWLLGVTESGYYGIVEITSPFQYNREWIDF